MAAAGISVSDEEMRPAQRIKILLVDDTPDNLVSLEAALYGLLVRMTGNPMARLSHVVAISMVEGPAAGLVLLDQFEGDDRDNFSKTIGGHHRLDAVRGHLYERAGNRDAAVKHYRAAAPAYSAEPPSI